MGWGCTSEADLDGLSFQVLQRYCQRTFPCSTTGGGGGGGASTSGAQSQSQSQVMVGGIGGMSFTISELILGLLIFWLLGFAMGYVFSSIRNGWSSYAKKFPHANGTSNA